MNDEAIRKLAEYLTGTSVPFHSIGLSIGGDRKIGADNFFKLRDAFGVIGYKSADEAEKSIRARLSV